MNEGTTSLALGMVGLVITIRSTTTAVTAATAATAAGLRHRNQGGRGGRAIRDGIGEVGTPALELAWGGVGDSAVLIDHDGDRTSFTQLG